MQRKAKTMIEAGLENTNPTFFSVGHIIFGLLGDPSLVLGGYPMVATKEGDIIL